MELLDVFSILDPRILLSDEKDLAAHGLERLEVLMTSFEGSSWGINHEECTSKWDYLKRLIHNKCSSLTLQQVLRLLCNDKPLRAMFPQLTKLSTIAALVPVAQQNVNEHFLL